MKLGVDVLFEKQLDLVRGRRIGLITNPTGVDRAYRSIVERFRTTPGVTLAALYGPEHGYGGGHRKRRGSIFD
ncbi:MAG: exo-beta-N-acetylmuramidase NamZ domain-containing protein, partial [Verrucomicrobiota bacterium]